MSSFFSSRKGRILPVLLASLGLPLLLCVEAPFEIFGSNLEEFLFSLSDFLLPCLLYGLAAALLLGAFLFSLPQKAFRIAYPVTVMTAFLFFLQGTYLNGGLSSLPGDNMGVAGPPVGLVILNAALWLLGEGLAVGSAFLKKKEDIVKAVCLFLSVVVIGTQVVNTVFIALSTEDITLPADKRRHPSEELSDGEEGKQKFVTKKNLTVLGSEKNVIVFIVDRFDEDYAEKAYEETPGVYRDLTGFTWFQDSISLYGHTFPAVTWMLTDRTFSCDSDRVTYQNTAFEGDTPLKRLSDAGYTINVYTQAYYAYETEDRLPPYFANVETLLAPAPISLSNRFAIAGNLILMALYRCLPLSLKNVIGDIDSQANADIVLQSRADNAYSLDMKNVWEEICRQDFTLSGKKSYHFIHITGCHGVDYNERFEKPSASEARDSAVSVRVSFKIINRYLDEMKRLGVYDAATIIITGDHSAPIRDDREVREPRLTALFVKPSSSSGTPLVISSAQVAHTDLWATVFDSEGFGTEDYGDSVFSVKEGENRVRTYCWQTHLREKTLDEYFYSVSGPARDFSNWTEISHRHWDKSLMD